MNTRRKRLADFVLVFGSLFLFSNVAVGQNLWHFLDGPYGGRITGMAETSTGILYAGTYGAGLQRSTNGGISWVQVNFTPTHHNQTVHVVFVDENDKIFVASAEGQIYVSDTGSNFELISEVVGFPTALSRNPTNGKLMLVLQDGSYNYSLFDSPNDGETWDLIAQNSPLMTGSFTDLNIKPDGTLVGVTGLNGVIVSIDGGLNFSPRNGSIPINVEPTYSMVVAPNGDLYRLTYKNIYRSADVGVTWTSIKGNLPGSHFSGRLLIRENSLFFFNAADNTSGSQSVFVSPLGTNTWTRVSNEFPVYEGERFNMFCSAVGGMFSITDGKGLWQSRDHGATWEHSDQGITAMDFQDLVETSERTLIMSDAGGLTTFDPAVSTWYRFSFSAQPFIAKPKVVTFDTGVDAMVVNGANIYSTSDGGRTWSTSLNSSYFFWTAAEANQKIYAYATRQMDGTRVILRSDDRGASWIVEYFFPSVGGGFNMEHFAMDENRNAYVGILEPDNSMSVQKINLDTKNQTLLHNTPFLFGLYAEEGGLYIVRPGVGYQVLYSDNEGMSFTEIPNTPQMIEPPRIQVHGNELFLLGPFGAVFRTIDAGAHWESWLNLLEGYFTSTNDLVHTSTGNYYAVVQNKGLYIRLPALKLEQSITFAPMADREIRLGDFEPSVNATSGLLVTLVSSDETIARIEGNRIVPVSEGSVEITASQPGNDIFYPALPAQQTLNVVKSPQAITFNSLPGVTIASEPFDLSAISTSGLEVIFESTSLAISLSDKKVTMVQAGPATITASQPGDGMYLAAEDVIRTFCVNPLPPNLSIGTETARIITSDVTGMHTWYRDGVLLPGLSENFIEATVSGTYTASVVVNTCESALSEGVPLVITDLESQTLSTDLVFPNPAAVNSTVSIELAEPGPGTVAIYDIKGKEVKHAASTEQATIPLETSGLAPGLYLVTIRQSSVRVRRLIIR